MIKINKYTNYMYFNKHCFIDTNSKKIFTK